MMLVTAVIQPFVLDDVQKSLVRFGIKGMTVSEVSGYARQRGHKEVYRGETLQIDFILKVKLEILCSDDDAAGIIKIITDAARTGEVGDGKVWVTPVETVVRVRTGESGDEAV